MSHLMTKPIKWHVCPAKTQISLGIRPVWSVFTVGMKKAWVLSYLLSAQQRLWSDWADAQADLSLRWAHRSFCRFCHVAAHIDITVVGLLWWPFASVKNNETFCPWTLWRQLGQVLPTSTKTSCQMSNDHSPESKQSNLTSIYTGLQLDVCSPISKFQKDLIRNKTLLFKHFPIQKHKGENLTSRSNQDLFLPFDLT